MQSSVQMAAGFLMNGDPICTCIGKYRNKLVRILDHQVAIKWQLVTLRSDFTTGRPDRQVGHEMPIHDVHMNDGRATVACRAHLLAQPGEIRRKDGRCQFDQTGCPQKISSCLNACGNSNTSVEWQVLMWTLLPAKRQPSPSQAATSTKAAAR